MFNSAFSALLEMKESRAFVLNDTEMPCYAEDGRGLFHGWDHIDVDGVTRKCDNGFMKLPKCELNINLYFCKTLICDFVSDFGKKMRCHLPFKYIKNVGCIFVYTKQKFNYKEGLEYCQSLGAELIDYELKDAFSIFKYLKSVNRKSLNSEIFFLLILLLSVDDRSIWVGLNKAKNKNWYWRISGKEVKDINYWNLPRSRGKGGDCARLRDSWYSDGVKRSLVPTYCTVSDISP